VLARSLAAFCTSSYVLGIGDRHLDNFLMDLTDGGVVGRGGG
jgi:DNA-dependent protein kinase catalytic subunit